ncbi:MAG: hypothetical protein PHQ04_01195 [Opitutaceae bacterium]|nr:hypothetical protein [Opitutaceae bacterium]
MSGVVMPGGIRPTNNWLLAAIWATAPSTLAPGWRYTLIMPAPVKHWDSKCSISLTMVVIERSLRAMTRFSISNGVRPL